MLVVLLSSASFLQGDANSVQVSIQLKLNEKVKNSFEYCEVHLPFFHRFVVFAWFKTMMTACFVMIQIWFSLSNLVEKPFKVGSTLPLPFS